MSKKSAEQSPTPELILSEQLLFRAEMARSLLKFMASSQASERVLVKQVVHPCQMLDASYQVPLGELFEIGFGFSHTILPGNSSFRKSNRAIAYSSVLTEKRDGGMD